MCQWVGWQVELDRYSWSRWAGRASPGELAEEGRPRIAVEAGGVQLRWVVGRAGRDG